MFRFIIALCLVVCSFAFAPVGKSSATSLRMSTEDRSIALPFDRRPPALDGTLPGDVGFDPAGFTNKLPQKWLYGGGGSSLKWYQEAEIVHGRVAQLAVLGNYFPAFWHFPGNPAIGVPADAYASLNPYVAIQTVPDVAVWHTVTAIFAIEIFRAKNVIAGDKAPGDLGLGQNGWNPFGFNYTPEEYREKQVQEIKHGRLAMFGALGCILQNSISGKGAVEQLQEAFNRPEYTQNLFGPGTLNDFFPQGI